MDYRLVELSQLTDDEVKDLAILHHSVMHTLLSDLGLPIVLRYYQAAWTDGATLGICARSASGELLGWAMGSPHPDRINAGLRSPLIGFIAQMSRLLFTRPLVLWQLVSSALFASSQPALKPEAIELTYIGVATDQRGQGLGSKLLNAFIEASRSQGYRSVVLSVETENIPAIALYGGAGFNIVRTFTEGRYHRHRMELTLA